MHFFETPYQLRDKEKHSAKITEVNATQIINIQLAAGQSIAEHHAKENTIIIVRRGKVQFTVEGQQVVLTNEAVLAMDPLAQHDLLAIEDTDLLLLKVK